LRELLQEKAYFNKERSAQKKDLWEKTKGRRLKKKKLRNRTTAAPRRAAVVETTVEYHLLVICLRLTRVEPLVSAP
jgi:hypothetical protein